MENTRLTEPITLPEPEHSCRLPAQSAFCTLLVISVSLSWGGSIDGHDEQTRVINGMMREQKSRFEHFEGYTRLQHYSVTAERFGLKAELVARFHRDRVKGKTYEIISRSGSTTIQSHVFEPLLNAEVESSQEGELLTPANYAFHLQGTEDFSGKHCYVLQSDPKHKDKRLVKGRIWLDPDDFGTVHMEGRPSESLSFWVGRPMIVQDYTRIAGYWWISRRHSYIDNFLLGKSDLVIDYTDYQFEERRQPQDASAASQ